MRRVWRAASFYVRALRRSTPARCRASSAVAFRGAPRDAARRRIRRLHRGPDGGTRGIVQALPSSLERVSPPRSDDQSHRRSNGSLGTTAERRERPADPARRCWRCPSAGRTANQCAHGRVGVGTTRARGGAAAGRPAADVAGRGPRVSRVSETQRRQGADPDHRHQRALRAGQPRARPGHGRDHPEDLVGQHATGVGLGPRRLHGQPGRPSLSGRQLLHCRARQRAELLRVGGGGGLRQHDLGVLRRDQSPVAERLHQHDPGRDRAGRDAPSNGLAGAEPAHHRHEALLERVRRDGHRSGDRAEPDRAQPRGPSPVSRSHPT